MIEMKIAHGLLVLLVGYGAGIVTGLLVAKELAKRKMSKNQGTGGQGG